MTWAHVSWGGGVDDGNATLAMSTLKLLKKILFTRNPKDHIILNTFLSCRLHNTKEDNFKLFKIFVG